MVHVPVHTGGGCGEARPGPGSSKSSTRAGSRNPSFYALKRSQSSDNVFNGGGEQDGLPVLARLQVWECTHVHGRTQRRIKDARKAPMPRQIRTHTTHPHMQKAVDTHRYADMRTCGDGAPLARFVRGHCCILVRTGDMFVLLVMPIQSGPHSHL